MSFPPLSPLPSTRSPYFAKYQTHTHLVPELGLRLGALVDLMIRHREASHDALPDELLKGWLLDPLSRQLMGNITNGLFRVYRPDLKTWEQRYDALEKNKDLSRRTVERWKTSSKTVIPKVNHLDELSKWLHDSCDMRFRESHDVRQIASFLLGLGRLLMVWRRLLERHLDPARVDEVASEIRNLSEIFLDILSSDAVRQVVWAEFEKTFEGEEASAPESLARRDRSVLVACFIHPPMCLRQAVALATTRNQCWKLLVIF